MMKKKRTRQTKAKPAEPQPTTPAAEEIENEEMENEEVNGSVDQSVEETEENEMNGEENEQAPEDDEAEVEGKFRPETKAINDREGLLSRYEDIILGSGRSLPWLERLEIITPEPIVVSSVNDDLAREAAFYAQALQSVNRAIDAFTEQGFQWRRPDDYFAEMLKSDEHMQKVRAQLLAEKTNLEAAVEKRKQREIKKYGKEVQRKRQEEKQKSKKEQLDAVKKWRQERKMGGAGGEEFDVGILDEAENNASKKRKAPSTPNKSHKRQAKDQKFGFGGKKRGAKKNTAESSADFSTTYNPKRGGKPAGRAGRGGGAGGRGGKRPGKAARQAGRGRH